MLKKFLSLFLILSLLTSFGLSQSVSASFSLSADSFILIDANTLDIIYENNAYKQRSMASTTKIMTAVVALESGRLEEEVTITKEMVAVEGTSLGLKAGDKITLHDLVKGMMLTSGNDSANAIAYFLADNLKAFAGLMNRKGKEIGMQNTSFVTPSGLDDDNHYTNAYDMAILTAYALENGLFSEIVSSRTAEISMGNPMQKVTVYNHNRLLNSYEGCIGVKTGFTKKSGRCLVSAAERDGMRLVCVTLNAPSDWTDHKKLLDYGFEQRNTIQFSGLQKDIKAVVVGGEKAEISLETGEIEVNFSKSFNRSEVQEKILLKRFYYAPIKSGDILGKIVYTYREKEIVTADIIAGETANIRE